MGRKRKRLARICILIFAVIILLMAACEKGTQSSQEETEPVPAQEVQNSKPVQTKTADDAETAADSSEQADTEEEKRLTVGKPYSVNLVEEGSRNVLIIGEDKMNSLYDTIGIVSIDSSNKKVKIIMIPRDTYIEYNDDIRAVLENAGLLHSPGIFKINYTHHIGSKINYEGRFESSSISFLADVVEEKFNVEIHDYVKINTKGFRELIDYLGGVDIYVPYRMNYRDPTQDLVIDIQPGNQHLDGNDSEGFVRFRQGYRDDGTFFEIGDTGRKQNQLNFLRQLIRQKGTIKNIGKIPGIIKILGRNIQHSIGLGDVLSTYIGLATDIVTKDYEIVLENINSDKMIRIDGSSYIVLE